MIASQCIEGLVARLSCPLPQRARLPRPCSQAFADTTLRPAPNWCVSYVSPSPTIAISRLRHAAMTIRYGYFNYELLVKA